MKWMLILPQHTPKMAKYVSAFLDEWQRQYGFQIIDASDSPSQYTDNKNLIVVVTAKSQSKLSSWLSNSLRYSPIIKKWHIDKILLPGHFIKVDTDLPQLFIVNQQQLSLKEEENSFIQKHNFSFLTYDDKVKQYIQNIFPEKSVALYNPGISNSFKPATWEESLDIREVYSDGTDFFLVNSIGQNIDYSIQLLKGFSIFKKWQKSSMKIVFLTDDVLALQQSVANYKYRDDVRIINQPNENERTKIIASAYCAIHLPQDDSNNLFAMETFQSNVPLLLHKNSTMFEWIENNAFQIDELSFETIGQAFITMYKAENVRSRFINYMEENPLKIPTGDFKL